MSETKGSYGPKQNDDLRAAPEVTAHPGDNFDIHIGEQTPVTIAGVDAAIAWAVARLSTEYAVQITPQGAARSSPFATVIVRRGDSNDFRRRNRDRLGIAQAACSWERQISGGWDR